MKDEILRFPALREVVSLSRPTIFRMEREGTFPARRRISSRNVGWVRAEIDAWIQSRAAVVGNVGKSKEPASSEEEFGTKGRVNKKKSNGNTVH